MRHNEECGDEEESMKDMYNPVLRAGVRVQE